jgi:F0F1-type ATP synthase assembly protein I
VYAWKMKVARGTPATIVTGHYRAEGYKLAATAVLFAMTFVLYREISALPLFLTYVATLLVYRAALLFI